MARIIVETEGVDGRKSVMVMTERVLPSDLESNHFAKQLLERLNWAVEDAREAESRELAGVS